MLKPDGRSEPPSDQSNGIAARSGPTIVPIRVQPGVDPLDGFRPEQDDQQSDPLDGFASSGSRPSGPPLGDRTRRFKGAFLAGVTLLVLALPVAGFLSSIRREGNADAGNTAAQTGRVVINSRPPGAVVVVDGAERGTTPVALDLPVGSHDILFRAGGSERRLSVAVEAGTRTSETIDLPPTPGAEAANTTGIERPPATPAPAVPVASQNVQQPEAAVEPGQLEINSEPGGARVSLDGSVVGVTPLVLRGVSPGRRTVVVSQGAAVVNRRIDVRSGATASVFVSLSQGIDTASGWFLVESPVELRILENGQLLGMSTSQGLVLPAGSHQLELANEETELHVAVTVQIDAGKPTRLSVPLPTGTLSLNATPWAEVFIDGRSLGMTPLGNVQVPVGRHDLVWRHPELGVKRSTVVVGARTPARATMDF